jgi:hypothetical protein
LLLDTQKGTFVVRQQILLPRHAWLPQHDPPFVVHDANMPFPQQVLPELQPEKPQHESAEFTQKGMMPVRQHFWLLLQRSKPKKPHC